MKKLFSIMLVLALLCGAMPAALAVDADPPLYEQFGYDNPEEYMVDYWDFVDPWVTYDWLSTQYTVHFAECQADPQFAAEYFGYDSIEDVKAEIEDGYSWVSLDQFYSDVALSMVWDDILSYVPPLSVQLNGATVVFPDAQPELTDDRTMVPFRAMAEAMGYTVNYSDGQKVSAAVGSHEIAFSIGSKTCDVDGTVYAMDVAPYIKDDRTYVPVRFFAEAMGMTVAWDEYANAAVVYDADLIASEIDKNYTAVNKWLAAQPEQDDTKAFRTAMSLALTYTEFNSIDGNISYPISGTLEVLSEGESFNMTIKCDLYNIVHLVMASSEYVDVESQQLIEMMRNNLENASLELIYDSDNDALFLRCPLLVQALSGYLDGMGGADAGIIMPTFSEDAWFQIDGVMESIFGIGELMDYSALEQFAQSATVGNYIVYMTELMTYRPSSICSDALEAGQMFSILFGDSNFKQSGNQYTANFDVTANYDGSELEQALDIMGLSYLKGYITLDASAGAFSTDLEYRTAAYYSFDSDVLYKIAANATATNGTLTLTVHEKNVGVLEMKMTVSQQSGVASPVKQPPTGSTVINLTKLFEGMYSDEVLEAPIGIVSGIA